MTTPSPRVTRLPSQATEGNAYGRKPQRRLPVLADRQQLEEYAREAYLIDGREPYRY